VTTRTELEFGIRPPRYRLPDETHLGHVRLAVADLERSVEWYSRVLGLDVAQRSATDAALSASGERRTLIELHEARGVRPVPRRGLLGLYHYALLLPDRPSLGRFISHVDELGLHAGMSDHLVSEAVYIDDPDGLGIEIYIDRPRSSWRHSGGQLTMATNPLDVGSVVAEGRGRPWTGLPAGTVVGHVHLFVGDIDKAAAFYHDVLGFDKIVWSYPGALFMSAGGYHHHLGTNIWAALSPPASEDDARLLEWEIVVPSVADIDALRASVANAHIPVADDSGAIVVRDPWGTAVRIRPA
jgi:catechol 2,3-dioxygenase